MSKKVGKPSKPGAKPAQPSVKPAVTGKPKGKSGR